MRKSEKRFCMRCKGEIKPDIDNERHYGTCPHCKRGSDFILSNKVKDEVAKEAQRRMDRNVMLDKYAVITTNRNSGISHVKCVGMAKLILHELHYHFITVNDKYTGKQEIYFYKDGYYIPGGEAVIRQQVDKYLDELTTIQRKNEVVDYIRNIEMLDRETLEPDARYVNMANGVYDIKTKKLLKKSYEYKFLNQIPVKYDPKAECKNIKKFFGEVLYADLIPTMQEMIGYCLYRKYTYHKAFLLYGGGQNGKGTAISLIQAFLGNHNTHTRSLKSLVTDKFSIADLYGKLANFGADISGGALVDTGVFKNLTGGEPITGERKFHGAFSFVNYAKLIFNANQVPYSKYDKTYGYFSRWIPITFPETFKPGGKGTNPDILQGLITQQELSGLFNWALEGLARLLKTRMFTSDSCADEDTMGEQWEKLGKPDMMYIKDKLKVDEGKT